MYGAHEDPYTYPGTRILINSENIKNAETLAAFELEVVNVRSESRFPVGNFDSQHYCQIHRHLFQDIYDWAGQYRTIRIAKNGNWFCYPEHIPSQMNTLFKTLQLNNDLKNLTRVEFTQSAAKLLADLNAIHPFRDGNGRTQLSFLSLLSEHAGWPVKLERLAPERFLHAMVRSFSGEMIMLEDEIKNLLV